MKNILLAIALMASTSAFALHNLENPDAIGDPFVDSSEEGTIPSGNLQKGEGDAFGSVTENPAPSGKVTPPGEHEPFWGGDPDGNQENFDK